jgi:hypothetical protein
MIDDHNKSDFLLILATVMIVAPLTVWITFVALDHLVVLTDPNDPLTKVGGLTPQQEIMRVKWGNSAIDCDCLEGQTETEVTALSFLDIAAATSTSSSGRFDQARRRRENAPGRLPVFLPIIRAALDDCPEAISRLVDLGLNAKGKPWSTSPSEVRIHSRNSVNWSSLPRLRIP